MTTTHPPLTDLGAAPPPPSWCVPGSAPEYHGDVASWSRDFGENVWIACEDHTVDGRILRSEPRISYFDPPRDGLTTDQAMGLAGELALAAQVLFSLQWPVQS